MDRWSRVLLLFAALAGAAGVAGAAAAAHVGGGANLETAAHFLLLHAAGIIALVAVATPAMGGRAMLLAGASLLLLGVVLFSGDLALRALMEVKLLGGSAPFGGTLMIAGWLMAAIGAPFLRRA